jgi:hypothetical protein
MSREPGTTVLLARSRAKHDELHVKGAINLRCADIANTAAAQRLPARTLLDIHASEIEFEAPRVP